VLLARPGKAEKKVLLVADRMALWADKAMSWHWKVMSVRQLLCAKYHRVLCKKIW
jgi:hypothetical protein